MASRGQIADQLLTVEAAAERMSTSVRFIRRLIAERRIAFVKLGRHVRIAEADIVAFIEAGRVDALDVPEIWPNRKRSA
jgi:excisionase family DNA binding protein